MPFWILLFTWLARLVLIVLAGLSIASIALILRRRRVLLALKKETGAEEVRRLIEAREWEKLKAWSRVNQGTRAELVKALLSVEGNEARERAHRSRLLELRSTLEQGLSPLATLGSNAPFVGLFGTVLGIIQAFAILSLRGADVSGVIFSVSEALIATAVGLFVAIPAVVAYNGFTRSIREWSSECEATKEFFLSRSG